MLREEFLGPMNVSQWELTDAIQDYHQLKKIA